MVHATCTQQQIQLQQIIQCFPLNPITGAFLHQVCLHRAGVGAFMHHLEQRFVYYRFNVRKRKSAVRCVPTKLYTPYTKLLTA